VKSAWTVVQEKQESTDEEIALFNSMIREKMKGKAVQRRLIATASQLSVKQAMEDSQPKNKYDALIQVEYYYYMLNIRL
jgi:hypothetical protein